MSALPEYGASSHRLIAADFVTVAVGATWPRFNGAHCEGDEGPGAVSGCLGIDRRSFRFGRGVTDADTAVHGGVTTHRLGTGGGQRGHAVLGVQRWSLQRAQPWQRVCCLENWAQLRRRTLHGPRTSNKLEWCE